MRNAGHERCRAAGESEHTHAQTQAESSQSSDMHVCVLPICVTSFIKCTISKPTCFQHLECDKLTKYLNSPCQQPVALLVHSAARFRLIRDALHIKCTIHRGKERRRQELTVRRGGMHEIWFQGLLALWGLSLGPSKPLD